MPSVYTHLSYKPTLSSNQTLVRIHFVAKATQTVDTLRIMLGNSGKYQADCELRIVDVAQDKTVGNLVQFSLAPAVQVVPARTNNLNPLLLNQGAYLPRTVINLAAGLLAGRKYAIEISYKPPDINSLTAPAQSSARYTTQLDVGGFAAGSSSPAWVVDMMNSVPKPANAAPGTNFIPLGGREGYQAAGTAYRVLDVMAHGSAMPLDNGYFAVSDIVPAGSGMTITAYAASTLAQVRQALAGQIYTLQAAAPANLAGWRLFAMGGSAGYANYAAWASQQPGYNLAAALAQLEPFGVLQSGAILPPRRFWVFQIDFAANALHDLTPRLLDLLVTYSDAPIVLGTHAQAVVFDTPANAYSARAGKCINKLTTTTQSLDAQAKTTMIGKVSLELAPEQAVGALLQRPLRAQKVMLRIGYADTQATLPIYQGIVRDMAYAGGRYTLTVQDPFEMLDVSVPRTKWPMWLSTTDYLSGTTVVYGDKSYLSLLPSGPTTRINGVLIGAAIPAVSVANKDGYWQDAGNVWVDIAYANGAHLADIALDLLSNQVNISSERIDIASIAAVRALYPNRTTSGRNIATPEKALTLLAELAWLLESYWTMRGGKIALIPEADSTAPPVMTITPHDIKESLQYRRGWAEMKNECLILTKYLGTGTGNEQYTNAVAFVDADSVYNYGINALHTFNDKWNVPEAELSSLAARFVTRWKNGRRIVRIDASLRLLPLETGDVVRLRSAQLPEFDVQELKAIVMQKDLDWVNQTLQLTLMEV